MSKFSNTTTTKNKNTTIKSLERDGLYVSSYKSVSGVSNNSNDANFTFDTTLASSSYSVIVSNNSITTYTVSEADKSTSGFKIVFSAAASSRTYSVMVLQK